MSEVLLQSAPAQAGDRDRAHLWHACLVKQIEGFSTWWSNRGPHGCLAVLRYSSSQLSSDSSAFGVHMGILVSGNARLCFCIQCCISAPLMMLWLSRVEPMHGSQKSCQVNGQSCQDLAACSFRCYVVVSGKWMACSSHIRGMAFEIDMLKNYYVCHDSSMSM